MDGLWLENGPFRLADSDHKIAVNPYRQERGWLLGKWLILLERHWLALCAWPGGAVKLFEYLDANSKIKAAPFSGISSRDRNSSGRGAVVVPLLDAHCEERGGVHFVLSNCSCTSPRVFWPSSDGRAAGPFPAGGGVGLPLTLVSCNTWVFVPKCLGG